METLRTGEMMGLVYYVGITSEDLDMGFIGVEVNVDFSIVSN